MTALTQRERALTGLLADLARYTKDKVEEEHPMLSDFLWRVQGEAEGALEGAFDDDETLA